MKPVQKLPVCIQTFKEIIDNGFCYIDKTEYVWNLVETGKTYFLSRPRRFGKSELTTMLESCFRDEKELFKGL